MERRVVERAQHARDVAQRGIRPHPLGQRPAGSPSKSSSSQPAGCAGSGRGAGRRAPAGSAPVAERGHRVVGAADRVDVRRERGHLGGGAPSRSCSRRRARAASREARPSARRSSSCTTADGLAEPRGLAREVAAHLVGAQVGLGQQVAHAGQGHRPAVGRVGREVLQHRERERFAVEHALDRALERSDLIAVHRAQRPVHFQIGVEAGQHAAEQLEDRALAPRHRGVRLLDPQHPPRAPLGDLRVGLGDEPQAAYRAALPDRGRAAIR